MSLIPLICVWTSRTRVPHRDLQLMAITGVFLAWTFSFIS